MENWIRLVSDFQWLNLIQHSKKVYNSIKQLLSTHLHRGDRVVELGFWGEQGFKENWGFKWEPESIELRLILFGKGSIRYPDPSVIQYPLESLLCFHFDEQFRNYGGLFTLNSGLGGSSKPNLGRFYSVLFCRFNPSYNVSPGRYMPVVRHAAAQRGDSAKDSDSMEPVVQCMKWGLIPNFTKKNEKPDHFRMVGRKKKIWCWFSMVFSARGFCKYSPFMLVDMSGCSPTHGLHLS